MHGLRFAWASLIWFLAKLPPIARLLWRIIAVPLGWAGWLIVWFWNTAPMQSIVRPVARLEARIGRWLNRVLPKGLYTRALLIIIMPMVLLQTVVAYVFMERHWQAVTARLSQALSQDIAALIDVYDQFPSEKQARFITTIAEQRLGLDVDFMPAEPLPPPLQKPFFDILDQSLTGNWPRASSDRSGSTRWAARTWWRSASSSTRA